MPDPTEPVDPLDLAAVAVLERAGAGIVPSPDLEDRVAAGLGRHHRRQARHRALAVAAVLLVLTGAVTVIALARTNDGGDPVVAGPSSEPAPSTTAEARAVPPAPDPTQIAEARWATLDPAPLVDGRQDAAWATSDRYLLVWGGSVDGHDTPFDDGAVLDVRTGRWRRVGPFPGIAGRAAAGAVIEGDSAWVVGGQLSPTTVDGAMAPGPVSGEVVRIDLAAGTAEVVADSERAARTFPVVAVADDRLVVTGGSRGEDGHDLGTSVLDLAAGEWSDGDDLPWSTASDPLYGPADGPATLDGDEVVLVRRRNGGVEMARLDTRTSEVSGPTEVPVTPGLNVNDVLAVPGPTALVVLAEVADPVAAGVDPTTGEVRWTETLPVTGCEGPIDAAGAAGTVVVRSICGGIVGLDAATGDWRELPEPPDSSWAGRLVAVGDTLLHVNLGNPGGILNHAQPYPAVTAALTAEPAAPRPDAAAGRWEEVATAPFALDPVEAEAFVTSDRYVLTWGGQADGAEQPRADGAVLDLVTREWRRIEAVDGVAGRWGAAAAIDGDVAWVVGGTTAPRAGWADVDDEQTAVGEVVRIDLTTGATEVVATDERAARMEPAVAVHDGEVIVAGGRTDGEDRLGVAAYDPATGTWRDGPDLPWGTSSDDYTPHLATTVPAARSGADLVIARVVGDGPVGAERTDVRIDVARLDLGTLATTAGPSITVGTGFVWTGSVALVGGERPMVLYDRDGVTAVGLDGPDVAWSAALPLGSCQGPPFGQAAGGIAHVSICGAHTFVDPADGRTAEVPESPSGEDGLTVAGDRFLSIESATSGPLTAWVLVAG